MLILCWLSFGEVLKTAVDFFVSVRLEGINLVAEVNASQANEFTQYAYYLYDQGDVIRKQMYIDDATFSFPLSGGGQYFVRAYVRSKSFADEEYKIEAKNSAKITFYPVKKLRYEELAFENFRADTPTVYEVLWDGVKFEFLINYRPDSKRAVVFGNGALDGVPRS